MSELLVEHQCPQCGAPAILKETDRLFSCEFCRVNSYLLQDSFFRYMLPNAAPKTKDLVFFPYWRFKGMLFSCVDSGIEHKFIDVSHQAVESRYFPISLGLRSQSLKLNFVTPEIKGYFLKPMLSFKKVMDIFQNNFRQFLPKPVFRQSHVGDTVSLIYSPFYKEEKIYDAVLNKAITTVPPDDFETASLAGGRPNWRTQFIPTLCPDCGWDLKGRRDALVLNCKNCNSVWRPTKNGFKPLKFSIMQSTDENVIYLPFWRIKADVEGITLNSYADLIRIANLPKVIRRNWEDEEFRFWCPAFKVRPRVFIRLGRSITLSQPMEKMHKELPDARIHPVTLTIKGAVESLIINLASFMKPREDLFPKLKDITIKPNRYRLVYIPLVEHHHEFIQPKLYLTLNKNQLSLASNL
jgi:ribosomal protein L37AE/L43A